MKRGRKGEVEVPGDAVASAAAFERQLVRYGKALYDFERAVWKYEEDDIYIDSIRFRSPAGPDGEVLAIVKAYAGNAPVIAFHSGTPFAECVFGTITRMTNKSLKWREDKYANQGNDPGQT